MSNEIIKPPTSSNNSLATLKYTGERMFVKFNASCLKQDKIAFNQEKVVSIYIVYDLKSTLHYDEDITLENGLFDAVKLTKNDGISTNILAMVLDLMEKELFHILVLIMMILQSMTY